MATYINPLTDFGFKRLFGEEPNKDILIGFLNELLPERHRIADLSYTRNEQLGSGEVDRRAIFDVYCTSTSGERFIVELQKAKQNFFRDRSVYYSSFPIREQAMRGDWDFRLDAVYTIGILDFVFSEHEGNDELLHVVELKDQHCRVFFDKLKYIYIELPKFRKTEAELESNFDKWLYVFRYLSRLNERPAALREGVFEKLFAEAEISNFTPEERDRYESSLKYYRDLNNVIDTARQEGHAEGHAVGARSALVAVARKLLAAGSTPAEVARVVDLPLAEIARLAEADG